MLPLAFDGVGVAPWLVEKLSEIDRGGLKVAEYRHCQTCLARNLEVDPEGRCMSCVCRPIALQHLATCFIPPHRRACLLYGTIAIIPVAKGQDEFGVVPSGRSVFSRVACQVKLS